jgi:hypothetical protein
MRRADGLERHGLQFGTALKRVDEGLQPCLDRLAAGGHPIEQAFAVKVLDGRNSSRVRLRLQIAPVDQLPESLLYGLGRRRSGGPGRFGKHVVGTEMQAELTLRGCKDVENRAVQRRVVGHDMAEKGSRGCGSV